MTLTGNRESFQVSTLLNQIHWKIHEALYSNNPEVYTLLRYLNRTKGKMVRPLLLLLCYRLSQNKKYEIPSSLLNIAAAIELIHAASLIHDDIIDQGILRRGQAALHIVAGEKKATLIGDILIANAFKLIQQNSTKEVLELMINTTRLMCEGETKQIERAYDYSLTVNDYYQINYKKTSCLLEACCLVGSITAGNCQQGRISALKQFGKNLGYAFQISDDILDITSTSNKMGKPEGSDLQKGLLTLPLIIMIKNYGWENISELLKKPCTKEQQAKILQIAEKSGALQYSRDQVEKLCNEAAQSLYLFPPSTARDHLFHMLYTLKERVS